MEIFREIVQNKKDEDYRGDELEQDTGAGDHLTHDEPRWREPFPNHTILIGEDVPTTLVAFSIVVLPKRVIIETKFPKSRLHEATVCFSE